jgi:hypothetical protein
MSQFEVAQGLMDSASPAAKIVNEELDKFFESTKKRLQELDEHEGLDHSDSTEEEIRNLLSFRFGCHVAKNLVPAHRKGSPWNAFLMENFKRKLDEIEEEDGDNSLICSTRN